MKITINLENKKNQLTVNYFSIRSYLKSVFMLKKQAKDNSMTIKRNINFDLFKWNINIDNNNKLKIAK